MNWPASRSIPSNRRRDHADIPQDPHPPPELDVTGHPPVAPTPKAENCLFKRCPCGRTSRYSLALHDELEAVVAFLADVFEDGHGAVLLNFAFISKDRFSSAIVSRWGVCTCGRKINPSCSASVLKRNFPMIMKGRMMSGLAAEWETLDQAGVAEKSLETLREYPA